jgi:hypothetical protein
MRRGGRRVCVCVADDIQGVTERRPR